VALTRVFHEDFTISSLTKGYQILLKAVTNHQEIWIPYSLQCFDTVGWAAGRASSL